MELSPDGRQLDELGDNNGGAVVRIFDRLPDNQLVPRTGTGSCYDGDGAQGCIKVSALS
jgi:hypothetical protein